MDIQAKLLEIVQNSPLEDGVKATVVGMINRGPVTKSLLDDIQNLLEVKAMEQDQIEKIENQKVDIYTELSDKLKEVSAEEMEAGIKNLEQMAADLESVAKESKEHVRAVETPMAAPVEPTETISAPSAPVASSTFGTPVPEM